MDYEPAEAKSNLSELYLSWLSLAKPAKLNFFKTSASGKFPAGSFRHMTVSNFLCKFSKLVPKKFHNNCLSRDTRPYSTNAPEDEFMNVQIR